MNSALLLAHFDRISEAPDAIPRLRRFVLDLAIRGKLVPQDPAEEPATELLSRIRAERKQQSNFWQATNKSVVSNKAPFALPRGWIWTYFPEIGTFGRGKSKHRPRNDKSLFRNGTHPLIQTGDVARSNGVITTYTGMYNETGLAQSSKWPKGTLCITIAANIADSGILAFDACFPDSVVGFSPALPINDARYFEYFVRTAKANLLEFAPATAQKNINLEILRAVAIPLPPLAEQQRIVAKISELMQLCDDFEEAASEQVVRRRRASSAALHDLSNGTTPENLRNRAQFYLEHIDDFTAQPAQLPVLRRTILTLAVQGRLVLQDPSDEPSSELLTRIQTDKQNRIVFGTLRKEKPLGAVADDDTPFTLPENWMWARIGTCALLTEYGTSVKSDEQLEGVPVLAMGNIQDGKVILDSRKKVSRLIDDLPQLLLKQFDLLYNRTNSAELVGKTGIYLGEDDAFTFASYLIRIRFNREFVNPGYVNLAMNAPYFRETQIVPELRQQCGQANVNGTKLRNMMIPIPPIAEQARIVARVGQLMELCDRLEGRLSSTQKTNGALLESVLHHALLNTGSVSIASASS